MTAMPAVCGRKSNDIGEIQIESYKTSHLLDTDLVQVLVGRAAERFLKHGFDIVSGGAKR